MARPPTRAVSHSYRPGISTQDFRRALLDIPVQVEQALGAVTRLARTNHGFERWLHKTYVHSLADPHYGLPLALDETGDQPLGLDSKVKLTDGRMKYVRETGRDSIFVDLRVPADWPLAFWHWMELKHAQRKFGPAVCRKGLREARDRLRAVHKSGSSASETLVVVGTGFSGLLDLLRLIRDAVGSLPMDFTSIFSGEGCETVHVVVVSIRG